MYWRGQYSPVNNVPLRLPWNRATTAAFQLSKGFMRFLLWETSFTGGGGGGSLVNNIRATLFTGGHFSLRHRYPEPLQLGRIILPVDSGDTLNSSRRST